MFDLGPHEQVQGARRKSAIAALHVPCLLKGHKPSWKSRVHSDELLGTLGCKSTKNSWLAAVRAALEADTAKLCGSLFKLAQTHAQMLGTTLALKLTGWFGRPYLRVVTQLESLASHCQHPRAQRPTFC